MDPLDQIYAGVRKKPKGTSSTLVNTLGNPRNTGLESFKHKILESLKKKPIKKISSGFVGESKGYLAK